MAGKENSTMNRRSLGGKGKETVKASKPRSVAPAPSWQDELRARAQASLSALQTPAAAQSPRRWKKQLQDADARVQASEAEAQQDAALLQAAQMRAQAADILTRELEKTLLTAQTRAHEMEQRAQAMEERALEAEAMIVRLKKSKSKIAKPAQESASRVADDDLREQLATAQTRARRAEMLAYDMEQRALAAEAIIAGSR